MLIGVLPLACWTLALHDQDLWWDELWSLRACALRGWRATLTDFEAANNHILSNLVNGLAARALAIGDVASAMDRVSWLRLLQAGVAALTLLYTYLVVRAFSAAPHAALAVAVSATCIPFLNFSLQLRGYGMSGLFLVMTVYHGWRCGDAKRVSAAIWLAASVAGLLYTVAFVAYAPVLAEVLGNRFVTRPPPERAFVLTELLPDVLWAFVSQRWLLLLPFAVGAWYVLSSGAGDECRRRWCSLVAWLLLPFALAFAHGTAPYDRTFVHLAPLFAILLATGVLFGLELVPK